MTERTRYLESMLFGNPDKVSFAPGGPRESTMKRWRSEGLGPDADWFDALCGEIGIAPDRSPSPRTPLGASFTMIPEFEEKILERRDGHLVVQDASGAHVEISDVYDFSYLRSARDFVTRRWHKFPVETREDWKEMRRRYDPSTPSRRPADIAAVSRALRDRDYVCGLTIAGPFWKLRDWCGFENLCMMMATDPGFVEEMAGFWREFVLAVLEPFLAAGIVLDYVIYNEDMAYKEKSMVSPAMARRFLSPSWRSWTERLNRSGCRCVMVDSDGCIAQLIPVWMEAGVHATIPIEVAAGNDIVAFRRTYGKGMSFQGGIDKRAIAKGGKTMEAEVMRVVPPLLEQGGFVPGCDHGVPPDISWPDFVAYGRLLAKLTGWR